MEETDRDRLDRRVDDRQERGVGRSELLPSRPEPAGHLVAIVPVDQRGRATGRLIVEMGSILTPDLDQITETFVGDQRGAGELPLQ